MPGLRNRSNWAPLLLKASCIKSCANGCSLGITAHLTYANIDPEPVEGVFVYPLAEKEVVVGFEAVIAGRIVSVQIQSRGKLEDCCLDCCPTSALDAPCTSGKDWCCCGNSSQDMQCTNGHLILDEDLERGTFIVSTGLIGSMEIVSIIISTTQELPTLENGAIHLVYPTVLTPIVRDRMVPSKSENGGRSEENGSTSCFSSGPGKADRLLESSQQCVHTIFSSPATNLSPYEFSFQLLVRGACLLAGLESPTHPLRADADPSAQSASVTCITLAEEHPYNRHLEIILHLSEPHSPLVILERGRLTFSQYEQQISARRDFIRCARKDPESDKKLEYVRKRYHKDILSSPVLMLNFCPNLLSEPPLLQRASRELLFLIDRSGSMSDHNIFKIKEAMLVAIKSVPPGTMLNIISFGSAVKTLFTTSKPCSDATLGQACEYLQRMRADMGGTNLLAALAWVYQQPAHRSCPRQLFILTDGSVNNVGKVLELVRRNTCSARCFGLGLGPRACRRLLQGVAKVTGGSSEFLTEEERLQPKLIKSLKKALEPVLTDVRIDWCQDELPNPCELLQQLLALPGEEEEDLEEALREISREISSEFSYLDLDSYSDVRQRIEDASYVQNQYVLTHCSISSDRGPLSGSPASDWTTVGLDTGSLPQGLERVPPQSRGASRAGSPLAAHNPLRQHRAQHGAGRSVVAGRGRWQRCAMSARSFSSPQGELDMHRLRRALEKVSFDQAVGGRLEESDSETQPSSRGALSHRSLTDSNGLLFPASPLDWDGFTDPECLFAAAPSDEAPALQARSLIHGLLGGRPVSWEVAVDLSPLWAQQTPVPATADPWGEIVHQLAARSVIRDFENMAEKEADIEHAERDPWQLSPPGPAKRYRMKAIQTSKSCNIICMYTSFTATDSSTTTTTSKGLKDGLQPLSTAGVRFGARRSSHASSRRQRSYSVGLGRRPSSRDSEELEDNFTSTDRDDTPASPCSLTSWDSSTGPNAHPASPSNTSTRSQRSIESKSVESFFGSRFNLGRLMSTNASGRQTALKPHCLSAEAEKPTETDTPNYLPLVHLQLASGAFRLNESYSVCIQIPLERLKRASPYTSHRTSLSLPIRCLSPPANPEETSAPTQAPTQAPDTAPDTGLSRGSTRPAVGRCLEPDTILSEPPSSEDGSPELPGGVPQADSGRGSETDMCEGSPLEPTEQQPGDSALTQTDLESLSWATAVALAWLEHRCAGYFVEWELIAAKADFWLRGQRLPEGLDLAGLRAAARQLFLLLRHWDENIQLNMLCYNPNNM
ncbi:hypothetical protein ACEWY4_006247 [Coilia grayii]|uniref:von Willebrand factor A domain containing 5B2 n=1 Tax=Coilia grayii TaxID=363190 RepID=A0ABD1KD75_9TELE